MKKIVILVLLVIFFSPSLFSKEIAGVNLPESISAGNTNLILNGAGTRTKLFMKMYIGALYLTERNSSPDKIIEADEPMAITLHITSSLITSERMEEATREGFQNSTRGDTAPVADGIEKFISVFKEKISENDIYEVIYLPGMGVEVKKNSSSKVIINGLEFKKALFGIWLCNKPAQESLKKQMLGK